MKVLYLRALLCGKLIQYFLQKPAFCWLFVTFFINAATQQVFGQFYKPSAVTVRMGETLPESFYQTVHQAVNARTGEGTTIKLADYRDKLIILDFWANWCKPCIASLNKLDSMQRAIKDDRYIVIPVTYQSPEAVNQIMQRLDWQMNSIVNDTTLAQVFPHGGIPHQVWVKEGTVIAFPRWHASMAADIQATLAGQHPYMLQNIQDLMLDPQKPVFVAGNGKTGLWYSNKYAKIARYLPDYRKEKLQYLTKGDSSVLYCNNQPIEQLFYQAFKSDIFPNLGWREGEGIRWEISDKLRNRFFRHRPQWSPGNTPQDDSMYLDWQKKNLFGYELRYPEVLKEDEARYFMQQDLNRFFGTYLHLTATIGPGPKLRYGVLKMLGSKAQTESLLKDGQGEDRQAGQYYHFTNRSFYILTMHINAGLTNGDGLHLNSPLVDSTGIARNAPISLHHPKAMDRGWTLNQINQELKRYGLYVEMEEKNVPMLVIREDPGAKDQPYPLNPLN